VVDTSGKIEVQISPPPAPTGNKTKKENEVLKEKRPLRVVNVKEGGPVLSLKSGGKD